MDTGWNFIKDFRLASEVLSGKDSEKIGLIAIAYFSKSISSLVVVGGELLFKRGSGGAGHPGKPQTYLLAGFATSFPSERTKGMITDSAPFSTEKVDPWHFTLIKVSPGPTSAPIVSTFKLL